MLFKFSSVLYFSKYHDCQRHTEVLVLFFFQRPCRLLKVFIFSSVCVTIDPGTSPVVASPSCLVELLLAIFWAMPLQEFIVQFKTKKKILLFVFGSSKGENGFENNLK